MSTSIRVRALGDIGEPELAGLCDVLIDCVSGGASVSFMLPMTRAKAETFWRGCAASAARGERVILVAEECAGENAAPSAAGAGAAGSTCAGVGPIVGTISVILAQPENQPHRGDIAKTLVHRRVRGQGVGAALLAAAERVAQDAGKTLLVLDSVTGSDGDRLYTRHGWQRCGEIPDYALWPGGGLCPTTVFYKRLG
jgi:GNAT superfamily N-acetyltransferase